MKSRVLFLKKMSREWSISLIALLLFIILVVTVWSESKNYYDRRTDERFEKKVQENIMRVEKRMKHYENVLHSGIGLFKASRDVNRKEWRIFIDELQIKSDYPGFQGIGFTKLIRSGEAASVVRKMNAEGHPAFAIKPAGQRERYSSVLYLEPEDQRNIQVIGYDLLFEPTRRAAVEKARDTGLPTVSGRVILIHEVQPNIQPGFLMFVPLYTAGAKTDTVAQRREAFIGCVYSSFRMKDLMRSIVLEDSILNFEIYDGTDTSEGSLLYRSFQPSAYRSHYHTERDIQIGGRTWHLHFSSTPKFDRENNTIYPLLFTAAGVGVYLILFFIIAYLYRSRQVLKMRTDELNEAQHITKLGSWRLDLVSGHLEWSDEIYEIFELAKEEIVPSYEGFLNAVHPDDREMIDTVYQNSLALQNKYTVVHRLRMKDGRIKYAREQGEHAYDENGNPVMSRGTLHDISELVESKLIIETDRERFQTIAELGADWYWEIDSQWKYVHMSENVEKILGFTADEMIGRMPFDYMSFDIYSTAHRELKNKLENHENLKDIIIAYISRNGSEVILEMNGSPIYDDNKMIKGYRGINRNVTEKKRLEYKLMERNKEFQTIFNTTKDGIAIVNLQTKFLYFNHAFAEFTGYTKEELLKLSCLGITHEKDKEKTFKNIERLIYGEEVESFEKMYIKKDGSPLIVDVSLVMMPDNERILASVKNITDEKMKAHEIAEAYDRMKLATDAANIGIWVWHVADNTIFWDENMCMMYGVAKERKNNIDYEIWRSALHFEDAERTETELKNAVLGIAPFDTTFRIVDAEGNIKYIHANAIVKRDEAGAPLTVIGSNRDITKRLEAEKFFKLHTRQAQMGEMVAMIAHQWRQPLAIINSLAGHIRLQEMMKDNENPDLIENLSKIEYQIMHLSQTISDFRDFFRPDKPQERLALSQLVHDAISLVDHALKSQGIEVSENFTDDIELLTYRNDVLQVLITLLKNALDAFAETNDTPHTIKITTGYDDEYGMIKIHDNAGGIAPDIMEKIFLPYFTTKISNQGTGLGLYMSKMVIEEHCNGILEVYSHGKETTFTIKLPLLKDKS